MKAYRTLQAFSLIATATVVTSCGGFRPPAPPPYGRSLDTPPAGNRYLQGTENLQPQQQPGVTPVLPGYANQPYTPPLPPGAADPAAVQPPITGTPPTTTPGAPSTPTAPVAGTTPPASVPSTQTPPPAAPSMPGQMPFGIKVPNKPGFVLSPYDKTAGIVDVQGIAPGKKVKCPYTDKIFLVP